MEIWWKKENYNKYIIIKESYMNKKMRSLAAVLSLIMLVRYSEAGMLAANVAGQKVVYQSQTIKWYSMIAQDIQLKLSLIHI